jgi:hypothetical protein
MIRLRFLEPREIGDTCHIRGDEIDAPPRLAAYYLWLGIAERVADEPATPLNDVPQATQAVASEPLEANARGAPDNVEQSDNEPGSADSLGPVPETARVAGEANADNRHGNDATRGSENAGRVWDGQDCAEPRESALGR